MARDIDLSIIIPVYNAEKYLKKCLDSVLIQPIDSYEVICVDDGSLDNSKEILDNYKKKYKHLRVIHKPNGGVISARIAGYNSAKGKYIGWVDADDFVSKKMFSVLINTAKKNDADMVYCNYNFYPDKVINKQKWYKPFKGQISWKLVLNNTIQWNKIVKKTLLDDLNITSLFETIGEGCYGLVFINAKKIISVDECLYNYRVGHSSLSSNFNNISWYETVVNRANNMYEYVTTNKYSEEWINYYKYRYLYYNLMLMIVSAYANDKNIFLNAKRIVSNEHFFSKKYKEYLRDSFSPFKLFFLKYFGSKSFCLMKIVTRTIFK